MWFLFFVILVQLRFLGLPGCTKMIAALSLTNLWASHQFFFFTPAHFLPKLFVQLNYATCINVRVKTKDINSVLISLLRGWMNGLVCRDTCRWTPCPWMSRDGQSRWDSTPDLPIAVQCACHKTITPHGIMFSKIFIFIISLLLVIYLFIYLFCTMQCVLSAIGTLNTVLARRLWGEKKQWRD